MTRRILSIAIAVVGSALGYLAAWTGGTALVQFAGTGRSAPDVFPHLLLALGVVLLAVATLSIVLSSAGVLVVGSLHLAVGLLAVLFPPQGLRGGFAPAFQLLNALNDVSREVSYGAYFAVTTGMGLMTGAALVAIGSASRSRVTAPAQTMRVVSAAVATIIGLPGFLLVLGAGGVIYRSAVVMFDGAPELAVILLVLGVGLVAGALYFTRWSSVGAVELGLVITILGLVFLVAPGLSAGAFGIAHPLGMGITSAGVSGNVLLVGVVITAAAIGAKLRADRAPRASV